MKKFDDIDELAVNTVRMLSIAAIQKANSGHPGLPMDAAPMAYDLWAQNLNINPDHPKWINRDRFVLSAGHGSSMLYSLLHLSGFNLSIDDLKSFRTLNSKTPGHPEYGVTDGVDSTTGPLGQGLGMAVGMAMAERHLSERFNKPGLEIFDHYTYALCGDGDLMEGISHEAASLVGNLGLGKLIVLYDSNDVSLDGPTKNAYSDNNEKRFTAYGWQYLRIEDGNSLSEIDKAISTAQQDLTHPTIIEVKTIIGFGSENQGTHLVHGSPLAKEDVEHVKRVYNWNYPDFEVPKLVQKRFNDTLVKRGKLYYDAWQGMMKKYKDRFADEYKELERVIAGELPENWQDSLPIYKLGESEASRVTSHKTIGVLAREIPELWGGSADLFSSNKTYIDANSNFEPDSYVERNIWFGVREFGEAAALNGISLHGGSRVFGSTFFVFSDYMKPAIRLAALQKQPVIYVFTHDSVAVGEDGPTHEPIEQLAGLRSIPDLTVIRPADPNETVSAWKVAIENKEQPTILVLSRQALPVLKNTGEQSRVGVAHGGYVISAERKDVAIDGILIASGSEVNLAIKSQSSLNDKGINVRVVSLPSWNLFEAQSDSYKESVLPKNIKKRLSIEMGATLGWEKYVGLDGVAVGIDEFGASGDGSKLIEKYGFTVDNIVAKFMELTD